MNLNSRVLAVLCILIFGVSAYAGKQGSQDAEIPGDDTAAQEATPDSAKGPLAVKGFLSIGSQATAEAPIAGTNGFVIGNARLSLSGDLKSNFKLLMQWDFVKPKPLIDALISFAPADGLRLKAGIFKVPFSEEYLIPAANIDTPNRSQAVTFLAPGRRTGVELTVPAPATGFFASGGIFNNSTEIANSNNDFLSAVRVGYVTGPQDHQVKAGVNFAYGRDSNVELPFSNLTPAKLSFSGIRTLAGADIRWTYKSMFVSSEAISAWLDANGTPYYVVSGYQLTGGYNFTEQYAGLLRFDSFDSREIGGLSQLAIVAFSASVPNTKVVTWQVGYQYAIQRRENSQLLATLNAVF